MKNEEAKHPVKAKSLKDRIKSVRSNIREEEEGEIKKDNRPQYVWKTLKKILCLKLNWMLKQTAEAAI